MVIGFGREDEITADAVLVAIGRRPPTDGLDLDAAGVEVGERGEVVVDDFLRTSAAGVYRAGDVTGGLQLTYESYDDYRVISDQISSSGSRSTVGWLIPTTTFVETPLLTIGISEDEARGSGREIEVRSERVTDIAIVPRPKIVGQPEGYANFIIDAATDEILSASLFCIDSEELINTVAVAVRHGFTASQLGSRVVVVPPPRRPTTHRHRD